MIMRWRVSGVVLIFGFFFTPTTGRGEDGIISCQDHNGMKIQWSITYKLPKVKNGTNPFYRDGSGYIFITPNSTEWTEAKEGIDDPESIIGRTLSPLFGNDSHQFAYVLYNDQPPHGPTIPNNGHTKGVILTKPNGGIWLLHSLPHFVSMSSPAYSFPTTGYSNGQIFLCLSLNLTQVDRIGEVLSYTRPHVYDHSIPDSMSGILPNLTNFLNGGPIRNPPWFKLINLNTPDMDFLIFAKGPKFRKEIYSDWIAPKLRTSLNVQSWLNGPNPLPSNCNSSYSVHNILLKDLGGQDFSTHSDHSKWAVGSEGENSWACIGDLNRMNHQRVRGGGVICTKNREIWDRLTSSVTEIQPCPRKRVKSVHSPKVPIHIALHYRNVKWIQK